jgi:putative toxin-antitoxin system antitoxin component (TIGR02293 family)
VFRERERGYAALITRARSGLPYVSLEAVATSYDITPAEIIDILHLPARTLARRKKERRLRADESDRLLRLARIAVLAEETLGSREKAARWLHTPIRALGSVTPLHHMDTDLGARQVEAVLHRISHGVYS